MSFIIPDLILEKLNCHECRKYLSVKPVKIYENGKIKCGRCCENDDGGVISIYGLVVENGLFRCVNRYDGCEKLVTYSNAMSHEEICFSRYYEYPVCPQPLRLPGYFLLNHFKKEHANNILHVPEFVINFLFCDFEKSWYLHKIDDNIFIIYGSYNLNEEYLKLKCFSLRDPEIARSIKHRFSVYSEANKLTVLTVYKPCSILGSNDLLEYSIKLSAIDNCKFVTIRFNIDVSNIARFIKLPETKTGFTDAYIQTECPLNDGVHSISGSRSFERLRYFCREINMTPQLLIGYVILALVFISVFSLEIAWLLSYIEQNFFSLEEIKPQPNFQPEPEPEPKGIKVLIKWFSKFSNNTQKYPKKDASSSELIKSIFGCCLYIMHEFLSSIICILNSIIESVYYDYN